MEEDIAALEGEWSEPDGFFWQIRGGVFDLRSFARALERVKRIPAREEPLLPRLVSLLWFAPSFMAWQRERVLERGGDGAAFSSACMSMHEEVVRVLGAP